MEPDDLELQHHRLQMARGEFADPPEALKEFDIWWDLNPNYSIGGGAEDGE